MLRIITLCVFICLLTGCTWDSDLEAVNEYALVNDGSSKVWLVNRLQDGDKDYTPIQFEYREVIVFHDSRNAYFYKLNSMGKKKGMKMYYWMDKELDEFGFRDAKHEFLFSMKYISRKKIILVPKKKSYKYTIELVPFPEY